MAETFPARLAAVQAAVEATLAVLLAAAPAPAPRLLEAMRYAALGGGKRLRPFVLIETARLLGTEGAGVLRAAAALECIHCYSLVHDDLPAMDDDDLRRGRPTVHRAYDEATAILAGDALQTLAFAILADPATDGDGSVRAALVASLATAAGHAGMAGGQMLDLSAPGAAMDEAAVLAMQALKTGTLFAAAADMGAILGRADATARAALVRYGARLGAAFQLADDLLDATGTPAAAGKATGKDAAAGKATLVSLLGVKEARVRLAATIAEAETALAPFGTAAGLLAALVRSLAEGDG